MRSDKLLFEGDTDFGHYQVIDTIYSGRLARILYSGDRQTAQSGLAQDDEHDLLFDYNQRFIELARGLDPERILLIGGGAFTLPIALLNDFPNLQLDIVELDKKLTDIAEAFFGFKPTKATNVYTGDGRAFLDNHEGMYDLIIIDAFIKAGVPKPLQTIEAAECFARHLRPDGVLAMNVIASYYGNRSNALCRKVAAFQSVFSDVEIFPAGQNESLWLPQNFVITAQNSSRNLQQYLRHTATGKLDVAANEALHDYV